MSEAGSLIFKLESLFAVRLRFWRFVNFERTSASSFEMMFSVKSSIVIYVYS